MSTTKPIQLGLCCLNITLKKQCIPIYPSRTIIQRVIKEKGIGELKRRVEQNIQDLLKMIEWNEQNGIKVFRLTSDLFPHKTNPNVEDYTYDFVKSELLEAGLLAKKYNQRLTFHPGFHNVIGTPKEDVFRKTIADLQYHCEVLDLMQMDKHSVLVVHGGGIYQNKAETLDRWCHNYNRLPDIIKKRLVLENCERNFSIEDCLYISNKVNIPIVLDTHHFECYQILHPEESFHQPEVYIPYILKTWESSGIKPKFHVSEQGTGKCGHHSDYVETIPEYLLEIPSKYNIFIDIMIEAKKKELAIFKLYQKYPFLNCKKKIKLTI